MHHQGHYNYIVDEIPVSRYLHSYPTLLISLLRAKNRHRVYWKRHESCQEPSRIGLKSACPDDGRQRQGGPAAVGPWARSCHFGGLQVFIQGGGIEWDPPRGPLHDVRVCASGEITEARRWAQAPVIRKSRVCRGPKSFFSPKAPRFSPPAFPRPSVFSGLLSHVPDATRPASETFSSQEKGDGHRGSLPCGPGILGHSLWASVSVTQG